MRIVVDLTSLADNFSGIERYALNISEQLINLDKKNTYIIFFKNNIHKDLLKYKENKNVEFKIINGGNKLIFNQVILLKELFKIKADKYLFMAFPSPLLFRKAGIINTIHDLTPWDYTGTMKFTSRSYFKASIRNAIKVSEKIITVSEFSKNRIIDKFRIKEVDIIYNGVSDVFLKASENLNFKLDNKISKKYNLPDKYIMCLCTLEPRKNIELLVESYIELRKKNKIDLKLVLVGRKGWKVDKLLSNINENYSKDIIVTGFVDDDDLPQIYIGAKCFVFPSLYEGFGIPIIEAMSLGVPVITSNTSSLPEVVGDCGLLFINNNKDDLQLKIREFINMKMQEVEDLSLRSKERAKRFNWKIEAHKLIKILQENR